MSEVVKVDNLIAAHGKIERLSALPLPVTVSYRLAKIAKFLAEEMRFFIAARDSLIKKHGVEDGSGNFKIEPKSKAWPDYVADLMLLVSEEVTFPFVKIDANDLPSITADEMAALGFMLTGLPEGDEADAAALARREQLTKRHSLDAVH
jgi:hypothetical protein